LNISIDLDMQKSMRIFIALELPATVISLLRTVQHDLIQLNMRARWVRPENIHLTLKFIGDMDPGDIDAVSTAMTAAAKGTSPIMLAVRGIGVFPNIKRPRVIWVGLGGDISSLLDFQSRLVEKLSAVGVARDKRSFKAHLTLGRIKQPPGADLIREMMTAYATLSSDEFSCDRAILFKSDLKPSGAVYTKLKQTNLGMPNVE
jgi:2'-5' RNA ligase